MQALRNEGIATLNMDRERFLFHAKTAKGSAKHAMMPPIYPPLAIFLLFALLLCVKSAASFLQLHAEKIPPI
jgi:hypothetical protein